MSLLDTLRQDLKESLQAKDAQWSSVLRMLFASIKNKEIEERKKEVGLGEEEVLSVIQKEAKKRRDSMEEFEKAGRQDLADKESSELALLSKYLPQELSDEEIKRVIQDGMRELGEVTEKDFGALMKIVMPSLKNKASGSRITQLAKEALSDKS